MKRKEVVKMKKEKIYVIYDYFYKTNARFDSVVKRGGNFSSLSIDKKMQKALERTRI